MGQFERMTMSDGADIAVYRHQGGDCVSESEFSVSIFSHTRVR